MSPSSNPIRVLFVHRWTSFHGGSPAVLLDILTHLDRRRFEPRVLTEGPGELSSRVQAIGVPVITHGLTPLTKGTVVRFGAEVAWYVRLLRKRRIALVHGNAGCGRRSVVLAAWICRIPYVQHVHNPITHARRNFSFRIARRILTVSDDIGAPLRSDPWFGHKTMTVYNAVDLADFDASEDRSAEIGAGNRPVVGTVGQLIPRKGIKTTILAMQTVLKTFPTALLVIVGCAPPDQPDYENECRALVRRLGLDGRVRFTGYRNDVPAWMRTFDVFVLPTQSEPFGKVIIEAMAAGCPVVASRVGGIPEIISDSGLGSLIAPDDPHSTAEAIVAFLADRERARRVGDAARAHVRRRFHVGSMMSNLEQVYRSVLAEAGSAGRQAPLASRLHDA